MRSPLELEVLGPAGDFSYFRYWVAETDAGTVWSCSAPTIRSGARSPFSKCSLVGGWRWKFAKPAS
jgi:hypothetical protein